MMIWGSKCWVLVNLQDKIELARPEYYCNNAIINIFDREPFSRSHPFFTFSASFNYIGH